MDTEMRMKQKATGTVLLFLLFAAGLVLIFLLNVGVGSAAVSYTHLAWAAGTRS